MALSQKYPGLMVVPWFNSEEWRHVHRLLQNRANRNHLKQAHEILQVWKKRTPNLPCGVEGTLILLDALLFEDNGRCATIIRPAYGMILIRFLNFCCASGDKQGTFSESVKACNIPEWIVNTRHDLAHKHRIPKTPILKKALEFCFDWVVKNYWDKQAETLVSHYSVSCLIEKNLEIALDLYCQINNLNYQHEGSFKMKHPNSDELSNKLESFSRSVNIKLFNSVQNTLQQLLNYVKENEKVLQPYQLKNIVSQTVLCFGEFFNLRDKDRYEEDKLVQLPRDYVDAWKNLIELMFELKLILHFLNELLDIVNSSLYEGVTRKLASLWIFHILLRFLMTELEEDVTMASKENFYLKKYPALKNVDAFELNEENKTVFEDVKTLRLPIIHNPNKYKLIFLSCFLHVCKYPERYVNDSVCLMGLVCNPVVRDVDLSYQLQTVPANLERKMHVEIVPRQVTTDRVEMDVDTDDSVCSKFRPVKDAELFKGCPLGVFAFQVRDKNPWVSREYEL